MQPRRRGFFARATLLVAWSTFWINALLFPCTDALAALARADCGTGSGSVAAAPALNPLKGLHADDAGEKPDPLCCHVLSPAPVTIHADTAFVTDHQPGDRSPVAAMTTARPFGVTPPEKLAAREIPPPRVPLYLRNSRLLN